MLKPDIPQDQIDAIRPILEPLLLRLHKQLEKLPHQAGSALHYCLASGLPRNEAGQ